MALTEVLARRTIRGAPASEELQGQDPEQAVQNSGCFQEVRRLCQGQERQDEDCPLR